MAYKQKGFPMHAGVSPIKQTTDREAVSHWKKWKADKYSKPNMKATTHMNTDYHLENKRAQNAKLTKVKKPSTPKNFNMTGKDSWTKRSKEILKKSTKKGGKVLGKRVTGVLGLLGAGTLNATATNPHVKKSEGEQIKNLLTKHKLKGGKK